MLIEMLLKIVADEVIKIVVNDLAEQPGLARFRQALQGETPEKAAFQRALAKSYLSFQKQQPGLVAGFFDDVYLKRPDVLIELAKVLQTGQEPQAQALISAWQAQFHKAPSIEMRAPVESFLKDLRQAVLAEKDLKPFVDSAALQELYGIAASGRSQTENGQRVVEILDEIRTLLTGQFEQEGHIPERRRKPRVLSGGIRSDEHLARLSVCLDRLTISQFKRLQHLVLSDSEYTDLTTPVTRKTFLQDLKRWERDYLVRLETSLRQNWGGLLADLLEPLPVPTTAPLSTAVPVQTPPSSMVTSAMVTSSMVTSAKATSAPPPTTKAPVNGIRFVNRDAELHAVLGYHVYNKHWVIDAPAGYGKSMFLSEVRRRLTELNWRSYWIGRDDWSSQSLQGLARAIVLQLGCDVPIDSRRGPRSMGLMVAACILDSLERADTPAAVTGVALMLDALDEMENTAVEQLAAFVGGIDEGLDSGGFFENEHYVSVFAAGRYLKRRVWQTDRFDTCDLSPYHYEAVRDTVSRTTRQVGVKMKPARLNAIAARLFYETGGHPLCMASILSQLASDRFTTLGDLGSISQTQVDAVVFPVIAEIEAEFKPKEAPLADILQELSVFRKSRAWFLTRLIGLGEIVWPAGGDDLEQQLMDTRLVQWSDGFLQDDILRRLMALRLRRQKPVRFAKICSLAAELYPEYLKQLTNPRRPEIICQEWLFQTIQKGVYVDGQRGAVLRQRVEDVLKQIIELLCCRWEPSETLWDLKESMRKDWELAFMCNYFLCDDGYCEDIYRDLIQQVPDHLPV